MKATTEERRTSTPTRLGARAIAPGIELDDLPVAVVVFDASGRTIRWNRRAVVLLHRPHTLVGTSMRDLLGRDIIWSSNDGSMQHLTLTVPLPHGSNTQLDAFIADATSPTGGRESVVTLIAHQNLQSTVVANNVPRVQPWRDVADRIRSVGPEAVCAVMGIVALQSINKGYSRSTGDEVITELHRRLTALCPPSSLIERVGGERFAIVVPLSAHDDRLMESLLAAVREPVSTSLGRVAVGASMGVAAGSTRSGLILLDQADHNLAAALQRGAGVIERNDAGGGPAAPAPARLAGPLLDAVAQGVISAHFQPVVDLQSIAVVEYEAYARWSGTNGAMTAAEFLETARDTGAIVQVGALVLREALDLCRRLRETPDAPNVRVSINVSVRELTDPAFASSIAAELERAELPPDALQIEISDHLGADEVARIKPVVAGMHSGGVRVALDGFGGVSANLLAIRDLSIDAVKLDPMVIANVCTRPAEAAMLRSILMLGRQLGVDMIAKGVETVDQHELLRRLGCAYGQGYLYGAPVPAVEIDGEALAPSCDTAVPADEAARLQELSAMVASGAFDDEQLPELVEAAASVCGTEMAAVTVVEADRHWFAARVGLDDVVLPREESLCTRTICADGPTSFADLDDLDGVHTPATRVLELRSYVGMPLVTSQGHALGALCVMSRQPRVLTDDQLVALRRLADHVVARIELRHFLNQPRQRATRVA